MIDTKLMKIVIKFHFIEYCFHLELKWINVNKLILNMISECLLKIGNRGTTLSPVMKLNSSQILTLFI